MQLLYLVIFAAAFVGSITNVNSAATPAVESAANAAQLPALDLGEQLAAALAAVQATIKPATANVEATAAAAADGLGINDGIEFGASKF